MPRSLLAALALSLTLPAGAASLPPVPTLRPAPPSKVVAGLRVCVRGEVRYRVDSQGRVRFLDHGQRFPDNLLRVTQSYDRAGRLGGVTVRQTGFAGRVLELRGTFDARGRLVNETGFRAPGVTAPLRSFLRPAPGRVEC
ncbi:hypothetical protein [Deinococcus budaensis]|uniref:Uncharacterized protein n=1 Tax=Deinococcus budaensis TaxID=1665626 RepID=A0A7W8LNL0_9DEIO|nr:hypothetical protein [Deinococcus budaensis]MBB5232625.1 hypothetical protein [Deinococcus budaensis]